MITPTYLTIDLETIPDLKAAEFLIPGGRDMSDDELRLELGKLYAKPGEDSASSWIKSALHKSWRSACWLLMKMGRRLKKLQRSSNQETNARLWRRSIVCWRIALF